MPDQTHIVAGEAIKALWGHTIAVGDQQLRIGPTGRLSVSQAVAERLLSQSGWVRCDAPQSQDEADTPEPAQAPAQETAPPPRRGKRRRSTR